MGNSNSQSVSRFTPCVFHGAQTKEDRLWKQVTKFATPENRVLPTPTGIQQRLRSTDNGNIIQSGGTISGRKANLHEHNQEPEFVQLLQKKNHANVSTIENTPFKTLYGHRKSHSDPDIVRMMICENESEDEHDDDELLLNQNNAIHNPRSIIALSPSKAKIKSRKKTRAPQPPHSNTLPRSFDRQSENKSDDQAFLFRKTSYHAETPRRPLPPIPTEELPPAPPAPPPDYNFKDYGTIKAWTKTYEKNRRTLDKWKLAKPISDNGTETSGSSRKQVTKSEEHNVNNCDGNAFCFRQNNRRSTPGCSNNVSYLNNGMSTKELHAAIINTAKKRAQRIEDNKTKNQNLIEFSNPKLLNSHNVLQEQNNIQFGDRGSFPYMNNLPVLNNSTTKLGFQQTLGQIGNDERACDKSPNIALPANDAFNILPKSKDLRKSIERHKNNQNNRRKNLSNSPDSKHAKWEVMRQPVQRFLPDRVESYSSSEEEMEIDLQLRPTLPRKPIQIPRFSPTDVWKSINLDLFKSPQRASDESSNDGDEVLEDKIRHINRPVAPRRQNDRSADSGISPDAGSPMPHIEGFDNLLNVAISTPNLTTFPVTDRINNAWIPQHDLGDDSDSGSEEACKMLYKSPLADGNAKFFMPNFMFPSRSLPRTEHQSTFLEENTFRPDKEKSKIASRRKKNLKNAEVQHFNSLRNLKKALGLRTKTPIPDEKPALDSNWSLSRSLPNFTENLNHGPKKQIKTSPYPVMDAIRRCNSESRTLQQSYDNGKPNNKENHIPCNTRVIRQNDFNRQTSEGHVIYLPEYSACERQNKHPRNGTRNESVPKKTRTKKKFSFQSTIKQEEKKKMEEQLTREAEAREKQRQKEIEWMNQVEEEFRKQRDKEKVNIRHQLRILNLQDKSTNLKASSEELLYHDPINPLNTNGILSSSTKYKKEPSLMSPQNRQVFVQDPPNEADCNDLKPTGMRKWLKRPNKCPHTENWNPIRPEPEGGRSSSEDCRLLDSRQTETMRPAYNNPSTKTSSKCNHPGNASCSPIGKISNISSSTESSDRSSARNSTNVHHKSNYEANADKLHSNSPPNKGPNSNMFSDDGYRFTRESVEEYELHTKLCRTNSGRTFESHSYYALERCKEGDTTKDSSKTSPRGKYNHTKPKNGVFSTRNFAKELKENVMKKAFDIRIPNPNPLRDSTSDESVSDKEESPRRPCHRAPRKKKEAREPSFSRNHPHRSAARKIGQANGHHLNGWTIGGTFTKSANNDL